MHNFDPSKLDNYSDEDLVQAYSKTLDKYRTEAEINLGFISRDEQWQRAMYRSYLRRLIRQMLVEADRRGINTDSWKTYEDYHGR